MKTGGDIYYEIKEEFDKFHKLREEKAICKHDTKEYKEIFERYDTKRKKILELLDKKYDEPTELAKQYLNSVYGKTQTLLDNMKPSPLEIEKEVK